MSPIGNALSSVASAQIERFREDLQRCAGNVLTVGVAVSGGPDSLALLLLAAGAMHANVRAATVDHGLRAGSRAEALHVAEICAGIGVAHDILTIDVPRDGQGLQGDARKVRYEALTDWAGRAGIGHVATAHHADDQAETLVMRLRRGSGVAGLSGIRPVRTATGIAIVRPLLGWRKEELAEIVASAGLASVDDPSNRDSRFDRTGARVLLARNPELHPVRLARSAAALQEADQALDWAAGQLWRERVNAPVDGSLAFVHGGLPAELKRRLLVRIFQTLAPAAKSRGGDVVDLLAKLEAGGVATLAGLFCEGGTVWKFKTAPPRAR